MKNSLTYQDRAGRRRLRVYVIAALLILSMMIVIAVIVLYQQAQAGQAMAATQPVVAETQTPSPSPDATVTEMTCPEDPEDWQLVDPFADIENDYMDIQPACVYDGLGRTVAWALAINMGYSRQEATDLLGFDQVPYQHMADLAVLLEGQPQRVEVRYTPLTGEYTTWAITANEVPAMAMVLAGCFRTSTVVNLERQEWGDGYPVVCVISAEDAKAYSIMMLGGHLFSDRMGGDDMLMKDWYIGYAGSGKWVWLGEAEDSFKVSSNDMDFFNDSMLAAYQAPYWDTQWLEGTYHLEMQPLPEGWRNANSEEELQAIGDLLKSP